jgi:hypothetical protein
VLGTVKEGGNPLWGFFENARYLSPLYMNDFRVLLCDDRMHIHLEAFAISRIVGNQQTLNPILMKFWRSIWEKGCEETLPYLHAC